MHFDAVVVGAGINGLSAARALSGLGAARVALVERFRIGHDRGGSHGTSRITRTSYHDADYARLVSAAQRDDWPRLERDAGETLVHAAPGLFFGPCDGGIAAYAAAAAAAAAPVDEVDIADARRRFPQFRLPNGTSALVDRSAGVIAADRTIAALGRLVRAAGVVVLEDTTVARIEPGPGALRIVTDRGALDTGRVIVAAGAWIARLVPSMAERVRVARQSVGYFEPDGEPADFRAPRFPVWVWIGREPHDHWYGLPEFGRPGIKAARHVTGGGDDDPDDVPRAPPSAETPPPAIDDVRVFLSETLVRPPRRLLAWERCLYTNERDERFIVGALPGDPRIVVGSACSGHAFKFGPLTGRVLAEIALRGTTTCPEFEAMRTRLAP